MSRKMSNCMPELYTLHSFEIGDFKMENSTNHIRIIIVIVGWLVKNDVLCCVGWFGHVWMYSCQPIVHSFWSNLVILMHGSICKLSLWCACIFKPRLIFDYFIGTFSFCFSHLWSYVLWSFYLIADFLRRISRFFQTSAETVAVAAVRRWRPFICPKFNVY